MVRVFFMLALFAAFVVAEVHAQSKDHTRMFQLGDSPSSVTSTDQENKRVARRELSDSIRKEIEKLHERIEELSKKLDEVLPDEHRNRLISPFLDSLGRLRQLPDIDLYSPFPKNFIIPNPQLIPEDHMLVLPEPPTTPKRSIPNPHFPGWRIELLRDMAVNGDSDGFISTPQPIVTNRLELPDGLARFLQPGASGVIVGQTK
ncbi:MAG: hypothetical protein JSS75_12105 [Bacteroidetes bacterium]|nr:hypothetical protein [Bacteroidota bacterium]